MADVMASRETSDTDGSEAEMAPGCPCTCCCGRTVLRVCRPGDLAGLGHCPHHSPSQMTHQGAHRGHHLITVTPDLCRWTWPHQCAHTSKPCTRGAAVTTTMHSGGCQPFRRGSPHTVMGISVAPVLPSSGHRLPPCPKLCPQAQAVPGPKTPHLRSSAATLSVELRVWPPCLCIR